jgi:hypothetical protein
VGKLGLEEPWIGNLKEIEDFDFLGKTSTVGRYLEGHIGKEDKTNRISPWTSLRFRVSMGAPVAILNASGEKRDSSVYNSVRRDPLNLPFIGQAVSVYQGGNIRFRLGC